MLLTEIKLNPDNPRNISEDKLEKLANSIRDFPKMMVQRPIVVKDGVVIGGNMRYRAIQQLGMTEIPDNWVSNADDYTEAERKRFIMQDNTEMGQHDWDIVANQYELEDLEAWGVDLPDTLTADEEVVEDEAPPVAEVAVSVLGEVYQLGRHRVMCGDSTSQINDLMVGTQSDMVFTDPPYGVDYEGGSKKRDKIENDAHQDDLYELLCPVFNACIQNSKSGHSIYVCHADNRRVPFTTAFLDSGYYLSSVVVWVKNNSTFGRSDYHWRHEPILYGWAANGSHKWHGDRKQDTVWQIDRPSTSLEHPTMKPIALVTRAIGNSTKSGDIVLDPFLGSGSTLIACQQTDRTCYGMELDPQYVDVIRKRYAKFTNNNELPENWEELTPVVTNTDGKQTT